MENENKYKDMKSFFRERIKTDITEHLVISRRFVDDDGKPIEFIIKAVTEAENEVLRMEARRPVGGELKFDSKNYCNRLLATSVVYPNLKNAELQRSWGVYSAEDLICKMLLAGEYSKLLNAVKKLCGFDENIQDLKNTIKN